MHVFNKLSLTLFFSFLGKLLESLKNNGVGGGGGDGGGEPPTPPHTPQRENINIVTSEGIAIRPPPPPPLDPLQQQALQARVSSSPASCSPETQLSLSGSAPMICGLFHVGRIFIIAAGEISGLWPRGSSVSEYLKLRKCLENEHSFVPKIFSSTPSMRENMSEAFLEEPLPHRCH